MTAISISIQKRNVGLNIILMLYVIISAAIGGCLLVLTLNGYKGFGIILAQVRRRSKYDRGRIENEN